MKTQIVQVNHPGIEKNIKGNEFNVIKNNGFTQVDNEIIRLWNTEKRHYRKLLLNKGNCLKGLNSNPIEGDLLFWGEWEAPSVFRPFKKKSFSNGVHIPFLNDADNQDSFQNTDPYIFGSNFKYACCSQTGIMKKLDKGSLILFGTTTNEGFMLDTVFVVKEHEEAESICENKAKNFSETYRKATIHRMKDHYVSCKKRNSKNRIYSGLSWSENKDIFSFVPCKLVNRKEKLYQHSKKLCLPPNSERLSFNVSKQKVGHPYNHFNGMDSVEVWKEIVNFALEQEYYLGVYFEEPTINNKLILKENMLKKTGHK